MLRTARLLSSSLLLAIAVALPAGAAPPSDAEINRLLAASRAQAMLAGTQQQMLSMQQQQFQQVLANPALTAGQRQQIEQIATRTGEVMRQNLAWPMLRRIYLEQYRKHFSREDVVAMAEFYESDTGQRMLDQMPELMAGTMAAIEQQLAPELERLRRELEAVAAQPSR